MEAYKFPGNDDGTSLEVEIDSYAIRIRAGRNDPNAEWWWASPSDAEALGLMLLNASRWTRPQR